jgi:glutathione synthase/RimK-type ligase-like ATP-grasp enzyme
MRVSAGAFSDPRSLASIETLLCASPELVRLRFARACCLEDLGRTHEAIAAYADVIEREAGHIGALTNLGCLLLERECADAAEPYLRAAVAAHPDDPVARVNLARLEAALGDLAAAIDAYDAVLAIRPDHVHAHLGLAALHERRGAPELARRHRTLAYARPRAWRYPYYGDMPPVRVLLLASASGGDVVSNLFFDERSVELSIVLADSVRRLDDVAAPDVVFNAIGDADRSAASLERARAICAGLGVPAINDPAAVARTGRVAIMHRLAGVAGVRVPRTERIARIDLRASTLAARGFTFPLLLRAPGHHAGMHFALVTTAGELAAVAATLPRDDLFAIEFVDVRDAAGDVRKYRVVAVDGRLYPVHLAIAREWKVHYFSAGMAESAAHRAEEARFIAEPAAVLGPAGMRALEAIVAALGLDYVGIDFAVDAAGRIVVFEANATMAVYHPPGEAMWAYRRPPIDAVIGAVRAMVAARASAVGSSA